MESGLCFVYSKPHLRMLKVNCVIEESPVKTLYRVLIF